MENEIECPHCGSVKTNKVSFTNYFCKDCFIEFTKSGKMYSILYDGNLVDYRVNEFENCG